MAKKKKKNKDKNKLNISLILSIVAILISLSQVIFENPFFQRYFNSPELNVYEIGFAKEPNGNRMRTSFGIENNGKNTATNVEIQLRVLKNDFVQFIPNTFELIKDDRKDIPIRNLIYKNKEMVPNEKVMILVSSNFNDFLDINRIDTLTFEKAIAKPEFQFGPYLQYVKHSKGKVFIEELDSIRLDRINIIEMK